MVTYAIPNFDLFNYFIKVIIIVIAIIINFINPNNVNFLSTNFYKVIIFFGLKGVEIPINYSKDFNISFI